MTLDSSIAIALPEAFELALRELVGPFPEDGAEDAVTHPGLLWATARLVDLPPQRRVQVPHPAPTERYEITPSEAPTTEVARRVGGACLAAYRAVGDWEGMAFPVLATALGRAVGDRVSRKALVEALSVARAGWRSLPQGSSVLRGAFPSRVDRTAVLTLVLAAKCPNGDSLEDLDDVIDALGLDVRALEDALAATWPELGPAAKRAVEERRRRTPRPPQAQTQAQSRSRGKTPPPGRVAVAPERRLPIVAIEPDPKLAAYAGSAPEWLRWLDGHSVAAMPAAGGVVLLVEWEDLCAAAAPHLVGSDGAFARAQEQIIPQALEQLEAGLAQALASVRAGTPVGSEGNAAPEAMAAVTAAAAECAIRVLMARSAGRSTAELDPVARKLDALPTQHWSGAAAALAKEGAADRLAPRLAAVASISSYVLHVPSAATFKHGGWLRAQLDKREWAWFERAVAPLAMAAIAARAVAAGCSWTGRFSVTAWATRGRVFDG